MSEKVNMTKNTDTLSHDDFVATEPARWDFSTPYDNEAPREQVNKLAGLVGELTEGGDVRALTPEHSLRERRGDTEMSGEKIDYRAFTILDADGAAKEVHVVLGGDDDGSDKLHIALTNVHGNDYDGIIAGRIAKENHPLDKRTARFLEAMTQDELIKKSLPETQE